jgi:hypothetical protein
MMIDVCGNGIGFIENGAVDFENRLGKKSRRPTTGKLACDDIELYNLVSSPIPATVAEIHGDIRVVVSART